MLHIVVPADIDDPLHPSGGNRYDRRVIDALRAAGHEVVEHHVASDLADVLHRLPGDGAPVLVDGLLAATMPDEFVHAAHRRRVGLLLHMMRGDQQERKVLSAAAAVVTTSNWGRAEVLQRYGLEPCQVSVATPGTDPQPEVRASADGASLLCVGVIDSHKGQDVLLAALATLNAFSWWLVCAGSLDRAPAFATALRRQAEDDGIASRVTFPGALSGADLDCAYANADVLVHPSHGEMYGLVIAEALARGLPVIGSDVGGVREALGEDGAGMLVPSDDPHALGAALRTWLTSRDIRTSMRAAALRRRATLPTWSSTAEAVWSAMHG